MYEQEFVSPLFSLIFGERHKRACILRGSILAPLAQRLAPVPPRYQQ